MKKYFIILLFLNLSNISFSQWVRVTGLDSFSISSIAVNQNNGSIYVIASQNNIFKGVYYRPNLTTSWSWISGLGSLTANKLDIDSLGTLYIATTSGVYYCSNNINCYSINNNLPSNFGVCTAINCISSIDSFLYVGTNAGIYRTLKTTINWQQFSQNLPLGSSANKILKYHNYLVASYSNNVYKSTISQANWISSTTINSQSFLPSTIFDMSAGDSAIYLASQGGAFTCAFRSIGDSMKFGPCTFTNFLTGGCIFAFQDRFWTGPFYGGVYQGINYGNNLNALVPNIPTQNPTALSLNRYGTAIIVGMANYSFTKGTGGLYYQDYFFPTLPIKINFFTATPQQNKVMLQWQTATETNNNYFTIQRRSNNDNWQTVAIVKSMGNSSTTKNYTFIDDNPLQGISYYRIQQTDFNGSVSYSEVREVTLNNKQQTINIYPNPAKGIVNINSNENTLLNIYNTLGKLVLCQHLLKGNNTILLNSLSNGVYVFNIISSKSNYYKVVKE